MLLIFYIAQDPQATMQLVAVIGKKQTRLRSVTGGMLHEQGLKAL